MTKNQMEALLMMLVQEFDESYFNRSGCVAGVSFRKFDWDYVSIGVTFGCYDSDTRMIYVNEFFRVPLNHGMYLKEVRGVLFHELIHGFLLNSAQPLRMGLFCDKKPDGDYHGPEFDRLESGYPDRITQEQMDRITPEIITWMMQSGLPV